SRLAEVIEEPGLLLYVLVMVDQEATSTEGVERACIQEEPCDQRIDVKGPHVAERDVASQPAQNRREIQPAVPARKLGSREVQREDDAGVQELTLVSGVRHVPVPPGKVKAELASDSLLDSDVVSVVTLRDVVKQATSKLVRLLNRGRHDCGRLR